MPPAAQGDTSDQVDAQTASRYSNAMQTSLATLPANCPRPLRIAVELQRSPAPLPAVPLDVDSVLLPYLPDMGETVIATQGATSERRDTLAPSEVVVTCAGGQGTPFAAQFTPPPPGVVSRVERVLWPQLGISCVRASRFLLEWANGRRFLESVELAKCGKSTPGQWRQASPLYASLHDAVDVARRSARLARTEDTLHELANGDIEGRKETLNRDGEVVSLSQGAIYDTKALALELAAGDPQRYGSAKAGSAGVTVNITISAPRADPASVARGVAATVTEADYLEA